MYDNGHVPSLELDQHGLRVGGGAEANATAVNAGLASAAAGGGVCSVSKPGVYRISRASLSIPEGVVLLHGPAVYLLDSSTLSPIWELEALNFVSTKTTIQPAFSVSKIPALTFGQEKPNNRAYQQNNLATYNGYQFCAFWNSANGLSIASRPFPESTYPNGVWTVVALTSLVATHGNDEHNVVTLFVTPDGYIFVGSITHTDPLGSRLLRSNTIGSIGTTSADWTVAALTGLNETSMTYLCAVRVKGVQYVIYRDGDSGNGDWYINKYNRASAGGLGTWVQLPKWIDGKTDTNSYYPQRFCVDRTGRFHTMGTFRHQAGATNENMGYMYSDDMVTWKKSNGSVIALPVRLSTIETAVVVAPTAAAGYFLNSGGLDVGPNGDVHFAMLKNNGATIYANNLWYGCRRGGIWSTQYITQWTNTATGTVSASRPQVVTTDAGRVLIITSHRDEYGDEVMCWDVTDLNNIIGPYPIARLAYYFGEFTFDSESLRTDNRLDFMSTPEANSSSVLLPTNGGGDDHWVNAPWNKLSPIVCSMDLAQITAVANGSVGLPRIDVVRSVNLPGSAAVTTTSTSAVIIPNLIANITDLLTIEKDGSLFYRMSVGGFQATSGSGKAGFTEFLTAATEAFTDAAVDPATDTIAVSGTHKWTTGDAWTLTVSSGSITGLVTATLYYVINTVAGSIKLASSLANALAGTAIDITAVAAGAFSLGRASVNTNYDALNWPVITANLTIEQTPWIPVSTLTRENGLSGAFLYGIYHVTTSGTFQITIANLEVGVLRCN